MRKIYQKKNQNGKTPLKPCFGGFTLVELLVVVLIIGILAAIAVPKYQKAVLKAKSAEYAVWVKRIVEAEQEYYMANGKYTGDIDELDIDYQKKWPNMSKSQDMSKGKDANGAMGLYIWTYEGNVFRVMVGEDLWADGRGGYGAQLHRSPAQNYPLVCAEYACHMVSPGSYCKKVMGATGEPFVNGSYCFRFYKLP